MTGAAFCAASRRGWYLSVMCFPSRPAPHGLIVCAPCARSGWRRVGGAGPARGAERRSQWSAGGMRLHRQAQQFVPKFQRRGVRLSLAEGRLVRCLPALVVKTNLVRPGWPVPSQFKRRVRAVVVKPSRFVRPVPVGALPNLAHPTAIDGSLPANPSRLRQSVRCPCLRFRRVFEHPAKAPHAIQRRSKTAAVIARLVVLAAPAGIVHVRHRAPQLAGRVRNNRQRPGVASGVPLLRPSINARQVCIAPARLHKQGSQAHNIAVKRTCRLRRFAPSRHSAYLQC